MVAQYVGMNAEVKIYATTFYSTTYSSRCMKDLKIVIVSWNVRELLGRCLASLPDACRGLDYEVIVVDNASSDRTREEFESGAKGREQRAEDDARPTITFIFNKDNRGFAKACNQGIAKLDARYILLLNPDAACPEGSLTRFIHEADKHPKAGIFGPELLNEDGTHQQSVRAFPGVWDQAGIMLKLHHVFPGLFRRYFGNTLDAKKEADVDQVMGACFLIRRELIEQIGGLDERYFIWFEEVDYCKQAAEHGWDVRYIPSVQVTHCGGTSFAQVFSLKKQKYFNNSLVKYFRKWHPGWRAAIIWTLQPVSLFLAWMVGKGQMAKGRGLGAGKAGGETGPRLTAHGAWPAWLIAILVLEVVSALTIFNDLWNSIALLAVALIVGILAIKRPTLAIAFLFLELMIGSKGQLLQLWGWPGLISLREAIFAVFLMGWAANAWKAGAIRSLPSLFRSRIEWVLLFIVVGYAGLRGIALGNPLMVADGNAWGFLLLLFPVLELANRQSESLRRDVFPVLLIAPLWLALKTIGLEYLFSHGFPSISPQAYLWVRRTGVGEVTLIVGNAFRIFMQSYIYYVPALLLGVSWLVGAGRESWVVSRGSEKIPDAQTNSKRIPQNTRLMAHYVPWLLISTFVALGISLSRSLWMGSAAGLLALAIFYRKRLLKQGRTLAVLIGLGIASLAIIFAIIAFPLPRVDYASLAELFGSRVSTVDAASVSRWHLLPVVWDKIMEHPILGSGFGATVTYKTQDPRILAANPDGMYTTYAFEWGWLEHWVKFGLFGFVLMIWLVYRIYRRVGASQSPEWLVYGVQASLIAIAVVHIFTPYLNHPLGLGLLFMAEAVRLCSAVIKVFDKESEDYKVLTDHETQVMG